MRSVLPRLPRPKYWPRDVKSGRTFSLRSTVLEYPPKSGPKVVRPFDLVTVLLILGMSLEVVSMHLGPGPDFLASSR